MRKKIIIIAAIFVVSVAFAGNHSSITQITPKNLILKINQKLKSMIHQIESTRLPWYFNI